MLAGVEAAVLNGGAVLCHPEWPVPLVSRMMTRLLVLDVSRPILRGQQVTWKGTGGLQLLHLASTDCFTWLLELSRVGPMSACCMTCTATLHVPPH